MVPFLQEGKLVMHGNAILYGSDPNENDNFEEGELVMHGYKIHVSCMKGTILLIDFHLIFESTNA